MEDNTEEDLTYGNMMKYWNDFTAFVDSLPEKSVLSHNNDR